MPKAERDGLNAKRIAGDFLCVDVIQPVAIGCVAAKGNAPPHVPDKRFHAAGKHPPALFTAKNLFAGFRIDAHHLAVLRDDSALASGDHNYGAVGDDIRVTLIAAALTHQLAGALHQDFAVHFVTHKGFLP